MPKPAVPALPKDILDFPQPEILEAMKQLNAALDRSHLKVRQATLPPGASRPFDAAARPAAWVWALSGGGSKGSFQLGAALALARDRRFTPAGLAGTSVGSINVLGLAHGNAEGLAMLKDIWYKMVTRYDVYDWSNWVNRIDSIAELREEGIQIKSILDDASGGSVGDLFAAADELRFASGLSVAVGVGGIVLEPLGGVVAGLSGVLLGVFGFGRMAGLLEALREAEGVFNQHADGLLVFDPLRALVASRLRPALIREAALPLRFSMVALEDGLRYIVTERGEAWALEYVEPRFRTAFRQVGRIESDDLLIDVAIASASVPVLNPPVALQIDAGTAGTVRRHMVDGGVRDVLPIHGALHMVPWVQEKLGGAAPVGVVMIAAGAISPRSDAILVSADEPTRYDRKTLMRTAPRALALALDEIVANERELLSFQLEERSILEISPSFELGDLTTLDPGLVQIGCAYGYMTAFDRVRQMDLGMSFEQYIDQATLLWHSTNLIAQLRHRAWMLERQVVEWSIAMVAADATTRPEARRSFRTEVLEEIRAIKWAIAAATVLRAQRWGLQSLPAPEDLSDGDGPNVNCFADWWRHFERHRHTRPPRIRVPGEMPTEPRLRRHYNRARASLEELKVLDGPGPSLRDVVEGRWFSRSETPWSVTSLPPIVSAVFSALPDFLLSYDATPPVASDGVQPPMTAFEQLPDYCAVRIEGYLLPTPGPGFVPLNHFWSASRIDNLTTSSIVPGDEYQLVRTIGFVYDPALPPPANTLPLHTWWSNRRSDHVTTTDMRYTTDGRAPRPLLELEGGYQHVLLEGHVLDPAIAPPISAIPLIRWFSPSRLDNATLTDWTMEGAMRKMR